MSLNAADIAFVKELFGDIPDLSTRRMFGGLGLYADGVIFALMRSDGQILLKAVTPAFEETLARQGARKWTYTRKSGKDTAMPYWSLPDSALDDPEEAAALARRALADLR